MPTRNDSVTGGSSRHQLAGVGADRPVIEIPTSDRAQDATIARVERSRLQLTEAQWTALAILGYCLAAVVYTFPLALHLPDAVVADADPFLNSWILAWDVHTLSTNPLHVFDANIFFPFPQSLTYSESMFTGALMVAPVEWLTANPALAQNVLLLMSFVLAGVGTCLLIVDLTHDRFAGFLCGALFSFSLARQVHVEHVQLLQIGWLPLALLFLHRAVRGGRMRDYALFAIFGVCQALASFYLMWLMTVVLGTFLAFELITNRSFARWKHVSRLACALTIIAVCVLPVALPYAQTQQVFDFEWPLELLHNLSASPLDYLSALPRGLLYGSTLGQPQNSSLANEHELFPGFLPLVFAVIALPRIASGVAPWAQRREIARYALIAAVGFVLSLGPYQSFVDQTVQLKLPYALLYKYVPGFTAMRVPARFEFVVDLALAVLAAFGVVRLQRALSTTGQAWPRRVMFCAISAFAFLELLSTPLELRPVEAAGSPAVYSWLSTRETDSVVAEIPTVGMYGSRSTDYEYMSTYHWHPLVNGYSGFEPAGYAQIVAQLDAFPDPAAVENLRSLGVRYLVAHLDKLTAAEHERLAAADLSQLRVSVASSFGSDVVYELAPQISPSVPEDHMSLEIPSMAARGAPVWVTLSIVNDTQQPLVLGAPEQIGAELEWNQLGSITQPRQDVPLFLEPGHALAIKFQADPPASLASDSSAMLSVRLTGSAQLQARQTVEFADLPTSVQPSGQPAALEHVSVPTVVPYPHADPA
jgi:hypothetical protein